MQEAGNLAFCTPFIPIQYKEIKKLARESFVNTWQREWENRTSCRISKKFLPSVVDRKVITSRPVKDLQILAQVMTGHGLYKSHLRHWSDIRDHSCSLCGEDWEDSWHLWEMCPRLKDAQKELRNMTSNGLSLESAILRFAKLQELNT